MVKSKNYGLKVSNVCGHGTKDEHREYSGHCAVWLADRSPTRRLFAPQFKDGARYFTDRTISIAPSHLEPQYAEG
jgi:hypothetical protein